MTISVKTRRLLEMSANVAILIVAIIVIAKFALSRWQPRQLINSPIVGTKLSLPGVKWDEGITLVMALQRGCRYCEESAPFYRRLHEQRSASKPRMLALVPGDKSEIARYLSEQGVAVDEIINASLSDIHVSLTPTLVLVDEFGNVRDVWVGKLNPDQEIDAMRRILHSR